jgi:hypothetical protein
MYMYAGVSLDAIFQVGLTCLVGNESLKEPLDVVSQFSAEGDESLNVPLQSNLSTVPASIKIQHSASGFCPPASKKSHHSAKK